MGRPGFGFLASLPIFGYTFGPKSNSQHHSVLPIPELMLYEYKGGSSAVYVCQWPVPGRMFIQ
jgi:hypothetical protein